MILSPLIFTQLRLGMLRVGMELTVSEDMIRRIASHCPGQVSLSETAWNLSRSFADREYDLWWDEAGTSVTFKRIT